MAETGKPQVDAADLEAWLSHRYGGAIAEFEPLSGGFWSSAFGYRAGDEALVLRLGDSGEGYAIDQAAMRFDSPGLPVPEVLETGKYSLRLNSPDLHYAISRRHRGQFLELTTVVQANQAAAALSSLLAALRAVPAAQDQRVVWYEDDTATTWHDWLLAGLRERPGAPMGGWRHKLAADARLDDLFRRCESRIHTLLDHCPERRDLVHGDLLHQNVLVSEDASRVTAVFSWKCSAFGDFLYDVAWCTFWSDWHPGIKAADMWQRTKDAPDLAAHDLNDAGQRHHCFELQIAASHLAWSAQIDDRQSLEAVAEATSKLLARGPLT